MMARNLAKRGSLTKFQHGLISTHVSQSEEGQRMLQRWEKVPASIYKKAKPVSLCFSTTGRGRIFSHPGNERENTYRYAIINNCEQWGRFL